MKRNIEKMTAEKVLENMKELVGSEFDYDEIIMAFEDFEEGGETDVYVGKSDNAGYDYIAYINYVDATMFLIKTDEDNIIARVEMRCENHVR